MTPIPIKDLEKLLPGNVFTDEKSFQKHSGDLWPRRLIQKRLGQKMQLPIAVVEPGTISEVQKLVMWANQHKVSLIPFGGGSGVCGGAHITGNCVVMDLKRLNQVKDINTVSQTVTAGAGIFGPELEKALNQKGLTLAHFPASFDISTLGGWISTRASGQLSTYYGSIEDMLLSLKVVLADGSLVETKLTPRSATGPSLNELFLGSEGTLGVVVEATCQVHRLSTVREFLSFSFNDISKALLAVRTLLQKEIFPCGVRLYDESEAQVAFGEMGLNVSGNLLLITFEGEEAELIHVQTKIAKALCVKEGKDLGPAVAKHWWDHRFDLNEKKMIQILSSEGMILDTIEVAAPWHSLENLYHSMKKAIQEEIIVLAHFSHFYLTGGSIYFTFVGNVDEVDALKKYDFIWKKAMEACLASQGTISHHHGIGLLKKEWLKKELGEGWNVLSKIKKTLDPNHILNPDKLLS